MNLHLYLGGQGLQDRERRRVQRAVCLHAVGPRHVENTGIGDRRARRPIYRLQRRGVIRPGLKLHDRPRKRGDRTHGRLATDVKVG